MDLFQILFLAIVQSVTEFLPISSSAHLFLLPWLFGWNDQGLIFDAGIHLGTLIAVVIYFRSTFQKMLASLLNRKHESKDFVLLTNILLATLPALIVAFLLRQVLAEVFFRNPILISINLILWGFILWFADRKFKTPIDNIDSISRRDALLIGCAQILALVPGVSRSGITITAALFLGMKRKEAAEFSFLLSAPIIFLAGAASFYDILSRKVSSFSGLELIFAVITTSVLSFMVIKYFLKYLQYGSYVPFVIYRILLGLIIVFLTLQMYFYSPLF